MASKCDGRKKEEGSDNGRDGKGKEREIGFLRLKSTFRSSKVDHIAIFFEHVDLLNRLNRLDVELFQGRL